MLSFDVTPFTDMPAHRIFRSYFKKGTDDNEKQVSVDSELSHLWSEDRRHEEHRFATLMAELTAIAKELGVVVSATSDLVSALGAPIPEFKPYGRVEMALRIENERIYSQMVKRARASPPIVYAYKDSDVECLKEKHLEDQHHDQWLNGMSAKVQTLLQDARNVLGSTAILSSTAENPTEPSNDKHDDENSSGGGDDDDHDLSFDMVSLYMRDEASFTFEGPTFVEDNEGDKGIVASKSNGDWFSGLPANTSFSLDYCPDNLHDGSNPDECIYDYSSMNGTDEPVPIEVLVDKQPRVWLDDI